MLIPSAQTLEPIRKVPARKEIFGLSEYLGTVSGIKFKNAAPSTGCFSQDGEDFNTGISTDNPNPAQSYAWSRPDFIASRSSPIYGLSETVQTASIRTLCLVRAYQA